MPEAAKLYQRLVSEFGMPECGTLMALGNQWYEAPEGVGEDPEVAVSTAVFRLLPEAEVATIMANHASKWAATFATIEEKPADPVARLNQIIALAARR